MSVEVAVQDFPAAWHEPSFDDSVWGAAQIVPAGHIGGFALFTCERGSEYGHSNDEIH